MSAPTPGQWEAVGRYVRTRVTAEDPHGWFVADCYGPGGTENVDENTHLIASAPELLEELRTLSDMARKCVACDGSGRDNRFRDPEACKECSGVGELLDAGCELGCIRRLIALAEGSR